MDLASASVRRWRLIRFTVGQAGRNIAYGTERRRGGKARRWTSRQYIRPIRGRINESLQRRPHGDMDMHRTPIFCRIKKTRFAIPRFYNFRHDCSIGLVTGAKDKVICVNMLFVYGCIECMTRGLLRSMILWRGRLSICLPRGRLFLLIRQMAQLRRGHYYITVATCDSCMW